MAPGSDIQEVDITPGVLMQCPSRPRWPLRALALVLACSTWSDARAERPPLINAGNLVRTPATRKVKPEPVVQAEATVDRTPPTVLSCDQPAGPWPSEEGTLLESPITERERNEVALQIGRCARSVHLVADPWTVLALYRLEAQLGVPDDLRGILGAIWCIEGGMRTRAAGGGPLRGDIDERGQALALGPFQGHGWLWRWCGLDEQAADDIYLAARCYWSRVADRHGALDGRCGKRGWRVAEALTANGRKYAPQGCQAVSGHVRELDAWRAWERRAKRR
jgi:hypothetical protein